MTDPQAAPMQPTYYVQHPDRTHTKADPQPVLLPQAAGLVPPMPGRWQDERDPVLRHYRYLTSNVDWEEWPGGAAEILSAYETAKERTQAQAQRAEGAEAERDAMIESFKAVTESQLTAITILQDTLAQRNREVISLRTALQELVDDTDLDGPMADQPVHKEVKRILTSTAQAGGDAERRVREDEHGKIESVRSDLEDLLDIAERELCTDEQYERLGRVKAAILGTESGDTPSETNQESK
jgi:hypothetical protein